MLRPAFLAAAAHSLALLGCAFAIAPMGSAFSSAWRIAGGLAEATGGRLPEQGRGARRLTVRPCEGDGDGVGAAEGA